MRVVAAPGLKVIHPLTRRPLPPEGAIVPDGDPYWVRCLLSGDVVTIADYVPAVVQIADSRPVPKAKEVES